MTVLIAAPLADPHAQAVATALGKCGVAVELLDLADYPINLTLTIAFGDGDRRMQLRRPGTGAGHLDMEKVRAVWWRRPGTFSFPESMLPAHRRLAHSESSTAFHGMFAAMRASWINPPAEDELANHKPYQLAVAQAVGLEIPRTLMTSDPDELRAFRRECEDDVIYKQFIALPESWAETRKLGVAESQISDESIRMAPVIFQRRVAAIADLRVTIIGDDVFAAAVDLRDLEYAIDVRLNLNPRYVIHNLPIEVTAKLQALMHKLDLVYGAIDLRLTEDGRYVFLEINPAGQFLYVEEQTGQPIAQALASRLAAAV
jgi:hypothetical protein